MKTLSKYAKSRGVIVFAFNTATVDYVSIAVKAARLVKHTLGLPVTLVTDSLVDDLAFDTVQIVQNTFDNNRIGYESGTKWRNGNRYSAYTLSPYDETILIDSDYLVLDRNLLKLFDCTTDYKIMYDNSFLNSSTTHKMGTMGLEFLWATVILFKKTEHSEMLFDLVKRIQNNYQHYCSLYHISAGNFRNDYAFTIANHMLNGYTKEEAHGIPWTMLTVESRINAIDLFNNSLILREEGKATVIPKQNIHIIDKDYLSSNQYANLVEKICHGS